jgi:hypothetical protein
MDEREDLLHFRLCGTSPTMAAGRRIARTASAYCPGFGHRPGLGAGRESRAKKLVARVRDGPAMSGVEPDFHADGVGDDFRATEGCVMKNLGEGLRLPSARQQQFSERRAS